jgi:hypothetical protein
MPATRAVLPRHRLRRHIEAEPQGRRHQEVDAALVHVATVDPGLRPVGILPDRDLATNLHMSRVVTCTRVPLTYKNLQTKKNFKKKKQSH